MSKFSASGGLLLIPHPSRENPVIWSQFGLKLQNLWAQWGTIDKSNYSQFSKIKCPRPISPKIIQPYIFWSTLIFFQTLQYYDGVHEVDKTNICQFFKKIPFKHKWVICIQFGSKLQQFISPDLPCFKENFIRVIAA